MWSGKLFFGINQVIMNDSHKAKSGSTGKLGFWGLTGLVFGAVVGGAVFNLPQNMASGAAPGAVLWAWIITGAGFLLLVLCFRELSARRPDLKEGIYQYARAGFGDYAGFNVAWGYWVCIAAGNVAYAVMINDALGAFWPLLLRHGWPTVAFCLALVWTMYFVGCRGVTTAAALNSLMSVVKFSALVLVVVALALAFKADAFIAAWHAPTPEAGGEWTQVKSTMLTTVWCFMGIEGAVMVSARARRSEDVGRAGIAGFAAALVIYILVALLCYGVMPRGALATLEVPSVAYVLRNVCGDWAYYAVVGCVAFSLLGSWVAWTVFCAQTPYGAAKAGIMPSQFLILNRHGTPWRGLLVSSVVMSVVAVIVCMARDVYTAALNLASLMVLPAYLFAAMFMVKESLHPHPGDRWSFRSNTLGIALGACACMYCLWLFYAGGLETVAATSIFYLGGLGFFIQARSASAGRGETRRPVFTRAEKWACAGLTVCALASILIWVRSAAGL